MHVVYKVQNMEDQLVIENTIGNKVSDRKWNNENFITILTQCNLMPKRVLKDDAHATKSAEKRPYQLLVGQKMALLHITGTNQGNNVYQSGQ
jgi:hypothetical protein